MAIGKKLRFEVFKRDSFTCQYCGKKAPEVVLHVDHIMAKAEGGDDDLINLITSCADCNLGKGARALSDESVVVKRRSQLEELQERREQLEMMVEWQRSLVDLDALTVSEAIAFWCDLVDWGGVTEAGHDEVAKAIKRFGLQEVLAGMRSAAQGYVKREGRPEEIAASKETAFNKIASVCHFARLDGEKPWMKEVFYIRAVLRNRLDYYSAWESRELLEEAFSLGGKRDELYSIAAECSSYNNFKNRIGDYIDELRASRGEDED